MNQNMTYTACLYLEYDGPENTKAIISVEMTALYFS